SGQTGEVNGNKNWAYSQTNFEASPLDRPLEQFAPGVSWVGTESHPSESERKSIKTKYWVNTHDDDVRKWDVDVSATIGSLSSYSSPGEYPAGELLKNVTVDEHGMQVVEFRDKQGKVILKKV